MAALALAVPLGAVPATAAPVSDSAAGPVAVVPAEGTTAGTDAQASEAALTAAGTCRDGFRDVPAGSSLAEPVTWLTCQGITAGYADGTFGPHRSISRGETSAFIHRLVRPAFTPPTSSPFADVRPGTFYAPITWMHSRQIITGYSDTSFRPGRAITRAEMATILFRTAAPDYTAPSHSPFPDVPTTHPQYRSIAWMHDVGASGGYADGSYRPGRQISRGEMATLLWKSAPLLAREAGAVPPERPVPSSFAIAGAGWGHAVGMSQYGARAMAAGGSTHRQILDFYYSPATLQDSTLRAAQDIRVHLHSAPTTTLQGSGRVRVVGSGETRGAVSLSVQGDRVRVAVPGQSPRNLDTATIQWEGTRSWAGTASTLVVPRASGGTQPLTLRHGHLEVTVVKGQLNIVSVLRMNDEYLYGLAEMPASWPAAAQRAQAVAARSYALRNMASVKADCACHLWDEVRSQKFTGWGQEGIPTYGARWRQAVDDTVTRNASGVPASAQSLWHGGSVADATYYSSNGGHTRSNGDVWSGTTVPYLAARPDPYSLSAAANNPRAAWVKVVSQADLQRVFGLGDIISVRVDRGRDLTPATLTATSRDGRTTQISGRNVRAAFGLDSAFVHSITPR